MANREKLMDISWYTYIINDVKQDYPICRVKSDTTGLEQSIKVEYIVDSLMNIKVLWVIHFELQNFNKEK